MFRYQLIIFDWDGTLMDSLSRIVQCMQAAAQDLNIIPASAPAIENIVGLALGIAIRQLHPSLSDEKVELMRQRYSFHYIKAEAAPSPFFAGIPQMLRSLSQQGRLLSVATGKSRKGLSRVFGAHDVGALFHSSRCADETRSKPEPDMLLEILQLHNLSPAQAVMVGDTEYDLEMAARAKVDAVGVTWGAHDITRLRRHNPKVCVDRVEELSAWLHDDIA
ncbi:HAD-IA family hydrolase [Ketobacter sp. MCCC 1A13808]|uniref:HAD family hydrolase n=1 Tax=Ketobacter sp. MCCC 1A13808 TaxID=2602738 RepID=UPI0012EC25DD|nr:HAD-IA family hydrolase [Ketobacter sp. MCCC 1A13808]MVF10694.1 HAD-IA family hydrolase [Ketobacter sp. MCCC 1A13808]